MILSPLCEAEPKKAAILTGKERFQALIYSRLQQAQMSQLIASRASALPL